MSSAIVAPAVRPPSVSGGITVVVRVRDLPEPTKLCISATDHVIAVHHPAQQQAQPQRFRFERVLNSCRPETAAMMPLLWDGGAGETPQEAAQALPAVALQQDVFDATAAEALDLALRGVNACIFTYGATAGGKTFTLFGDPCHPHPSERVGLIQRTCAEIFPRLESLRAAHAAEGAAFSADVSVGFSEIYNEEVMCLVSGRQRLAVRQEPRTGAAFIEGLEVRRVASLDDVVAIIGAGVRRRHVGETHLNARSSRSHALFQLFIRTSVAAAAGAGARDFDATLTLVDLAGAERQQSAAAGTPHATASGGAGNSSSSSSTNFGSPTVSSFSSHHHQQQQQQLVAREGTAINLSLLHLAKVMTDCARGVRHINYRDSTLTFLLKESLGGNAKTYMIAAVNPAASSYSETLATLRYAMTVRHIKNTPTINQRVRLRQELERELVELRRRCELATQESAQWQREYNTLLLHTQQTQPGDGAKPAMARADRHHFHTCCEEEDGPLGPVPMQRGDVISPRLLPPSQRPTPHVRASQRCSGGEGGGLWLFCPSSTHASPDLPRRSPSPPTAAPGSPHHHQRQLLLIEVQTGGPDPRRRTPVASQLTSHIFRASAATPAAMQLTPTVAVEFVPPPAAAGCEGSFWAFHRREGSQEEAEERGGDKNANDILVDTIPLLADGPPLPVRHGTVIRGNERRVYIVADPLAVAAAAAAAVSTSCSSLVVSARSDASTVTAAAAAAEAAPTDDMAAVLRDRVRALEVALQYERSEKEFLRDSLAASRAPSSLVSRAPSSVARSPSPSCVFAECGGGAGHAARQGEDGPADAVSCRSGSCTSAPDRAPSHHHAFNSTARELRDELERSRSVVASMMQLGAVLSGADSNSDIECDGERGHDGDRPTDARNIIETPGAAAAAGGGAAAEMAARDSAADVNQDAQTSPFPAAERGGSCRSPTPQLSVTYRARNADVLDGVFSLSPANRASSQWRGGGRMSVAERLALVDQIELLRAQLDLQERLLANADLLRRQLEAANVELCAERAEQEKVFLREMEERDAQFADHRQHWHRHYELELQHQRDDLEARTSALCGQLLQFASDAEAAREDAVRALGNAAAEHHAAIQQAVRHTARRVLRAFTVATPAATAFDISSPEAGDARHHPRVAERGKETKAKGGGCGDRGPTKGPGGGNGVPVPRREHDEVLRKYNALLQRRSALASGEERRAQLEAQRVVRELQAELDAARAGVAVREAELAALVPVAVVLPSSATADEVVSLEALAARLRDAGASHATPAANSMTLPPELAGHIHASLRHAMARVKAASCALTKRNVQRLQIAIAATHAAPNNALQQHTAELHGILRELGAESRQPSRGTTSRRAWSAHTQEWGVTEAAINEFVCGARKRRIAQLMMGLAVWYDHWDHVLQLPAHFVLIELAANAPALVRLAVRACDGVEWPADAATPGKWPLSTSPTAAALPASQPAASPPVGVSSPPSRIPPSGSGVKRHSSIAWAEAEVEEGRAARSLPNADGASENDDDEAHTNAFDRCISAHRHLLCTPEGEEVEEQEQSSDDAEPQLRRRASAGRRELVLPMAAAEAEQWAALHRNASRASSRGSLIVAAGAEAASSTATARAGGPSTPGLITTARGAASPFARSRARPLFGSAERPDRGTSLAAADEASPPTARGETAAVASVVQGGKPVMAKAAAASAVAVRRIKRSYLSPPFGPSNTIPTAPGVAAPPPPASVAMLRRRGQPRT